MYKRNWYLVIIVSMAILFVSENIYSLSINDVKRKLKASTYTVSAINKKSEKKTTWSQGTAFFITDKLLITNHHVVETNASEISSFITVEKRKEDNNITFLARVSVLVYSKDFDLALLKIDDEDMHLRCKHPLKIDVSEALKDSIVFVFGFPHKQEAFTMGQFKKIVITENTVALMLFTAATSSGSSGSPVVDKSGNVIGVAVSRQESLSHVNYAVSAKYILSLINYAVEKGIVSEDEVAFMKESDQEY